MIEFLENNTPVSKRFKDVYFNKDNGLEETKHVFIDGNNLTKNIQRLETTTIIETGFGTGLNFLSAWDHFDKTAQSHQKLRFISVEKYPLSSLEIFRALKRWKSVFASKIDDLCTNYPLRIPGFHKIQFAKNVELLLIFEDIHDALPKLKLTTDFWFLDGFSPATNPDMWHEKLYKQMARLSHNGTRLATFTAAGHVRRGLENVGFNVSKAPGYGAKRDMTIGVFETGATRRTSKPLKEKIAIIGGGLAGCAAAYILKQYDQDVVIYEAHDSIANGASGNQIGLINPKLGSTGSEMQEYHASAFDLTYRLLKDQKFFNACGSLHISHTENRDKKFRKFHEQSNWHKDHAYYVDAKNTKDVCGIDLKFDGIFIPQSGFLSPQELCAFYTKDIDVKTNTKITLLDNIDADKIILANAYDSNFFTPELNLQPIKGQTTYIENELPLKTNLCYGGYISPNVNSQHCVGASFHRDENNVEITDEDNEFNLNLLNSVFEQGIKFKQKSEWVGVRCASKDRFPIVGHYKDNIYMSVAHGSHGIISSLMAAHILAWQFGLGIQPIGQNTVNRAKPERFL